MEENHLSLETLAKWLAGRLEHDAVLQHIVPHLVATCPVCRERYEQIRQLKREAGHEDEEVGVVEWREAPELLRLLEELPLPYPEARTLWTAHRRRQDRGGHAGAMCLGYRQQRSYFRLGGYRPVRDKSAPRQDPTFLFDFM